MLCSVCGARRNIADQFCKSCGTKHGSGKSAVPKRKSRNILAGILGSLLIFGALCLAVLIAIIIFVPDQVAPAAPSTPHRHARKPKAPEEVVYKMKDTVSIGEWSYEVARVRWANSIGSDFERQYPDAKFLIVDLLIRNNDRTASTLAPLKLVDAQGRQFDQSDKDIFLNGSFDPIKTLNPGVTSRGLILFDVPPGKYSLVVSGGLTSTGSARISLE